MILTYLILTAIVTTIVILLNILPPGSRKTVYSELQKDSVFKELQQLHKLQQSMATSPTVDFGIPEGYGEFGLEATNPIPINSIFAEKAYLDKLRTKKGVRVEYERIGSTGAPNIEHPIDQYEIKANRKYICDIYICPYYDILPDDIPAPKGFKIQRALSYGLDIQERKKDIIVGELIEFSILLLMNMLVIGLGTAILRKFHILPFLLVSLVNATWMYQYLLQWFKKH